MSDKPVDKDFMAKLMATLEENPNLLKELTKTLTPAKPAYQRPKLVKEDYILEHTTECKFCYSTVVKVYSAKWDIDRQAHVMEQLITGSLEGAETSLQVHTRLDRVNKCGNCTSWLIENLPVERMAQIIFEHLELIETSGMIRKPERLKSCESKQVDLTIEDSEQSEEEKEDYMNVQISLLELEVETLHAELEKAEAEREKFYSYYQALDEQLALWEMTTTEDAKNDIHRLICIEQQVAQDPNVNKVVADLILAERKRCAEIAKSYAEKENNSFETYLAERIATAIMEELK